MSSTQNNHPALTTNAETPRRLLAAKGHEVELVADGAQVRVTRVCSRCGGSGRYSFNLMHGDRCFGCMGGNPRWVELVAVVDYARELRDAETKYPTAARSDLRGRRQPPARLVRG